MHPSFRPKHLSANKHLVLKLHGLSTPTNTRDFTLLRDSRASGATQPAIPRTRLRLFYERPIKAHAIRTWLSTHPRIVIPVAAFLIGTLSYTFFDPVRAFFVKAKVDGYWDIEGYSIVKRLRGMVTSYTGYSFADSAAREGVSGINPAVVFGDDDEHHEEGAGKSAWSEREEAEKQIVGWLGEVPGESGRNRQKIESDRHNRNVYHYHGAPGIGQEWSVCCCQLMPFFYVNMSATQTLSRASLQTRKSRWRTLSRSPSQY